MFFEVDDGCAHISQVRGGDEDEGGIKFLKREYKSSRNLPTLLTADPTLIFYRIFFPGAF